MVHDLLRLREYQRQAVDAVHKAHDEGMQRPAVVMATGLGKTVILSHLAAEHIERRGSRVVVLVHRDELVNQTLDKLASVAPHLSLGRVKAADNELTADVMVCSVQTLARENRMNALLDAQTYAGPVGLTVCDEAHHAVATSYRNVMAALGCYDGTADHLAVGFTATLARGDGRGLGDVWDDAIFTRSVLWGVANGYLVDVRARQVEMEDLDLGSVKRSGGDYQAKSLGEAMQAAGAPELIRQVIDKHAADRRSILVFAPTVSLACEIQGHLSAAGIPAAVVHGGTPREERLEFYESFRTGRTRVIVNCMVLTEGADFPYADCAVIARPTRNETLFIQMVGRVLRPSPSTGKRDALVLLMSDGAGSIRTLIDLEPEVVVPVLDGESLAEAFERQEEIREQQNADRAAGEKARPLRLQLKTRDLDLFRSSPAYQWLRTTKGVQFIPLGGVGEIMLWPSEQAGLWDVVHAPEDPATRRRSKWMRLHTGLELGMAMAWGESEAEELSALNTGKNASWRKRRASEAQLNYARRLGFEVEPEMRAGEVGDMISTGVASRHIDRYAQHL